jgi:protease secretion system membrane fusion protein
MSSAALESLLDASEAVDTNHARPSRWGWWLLVVGLGAFLLWAGLAPLDGAVPAQGTVAVSGNRKLVQPVAAGKVAAILVRDGDVVTAGQVLVRLDETQSRSQLDVVRGQWMVAQATQARLLAEQADSQDIDFPPALMGWDKDARLADLIEVQSRLLQSRRQMRRNEVRGIEANLQGLEFQLQGIEVSRVSKETQIRMLREELKNQRTLSDEGFYPRNRVSEQERALAVLLGSLAEEVGSQGKTRQSIAEMRARMAARDQEFRKEIEGQLSDIQREAAALESRLHGLEFDVANTEVRAPVAGIVMGLALHTVGGVVAPGAVLMELVPKNEPLTIEVQLPVSLIDKVKPGMDVDLLFTAFNQATTPRIEGRVLQVSADALSDPRQNLSYFKVLLEVAPTGIAKLQKHEVRAGMPVEVFIKTGERTFMTYLFKPLQDRLHRALIEP